MKKFKAVLLGMAVVLSLGLIAGCSNNDDSDKKSADNGLEKIKKAGVVKIGIKEDVPNFGFLNPDTNKHEGMEIELSKKIAKDLTGSEDNIEFVGVTAKTRGPLLDNGEVDMIIATFTITDERKETYNFSTPYYQDEIGFLVRNDEGVDSMKDLDGKMIGVAQTATTKQSLEEKAKEIGITLEFSEYSTYPELKTALTSKRIDAFSVDKSILTGYVDKGTKILDDGFSPQEYGVATKKSNKELHEHLNKLIEGWESDGTLDEIYANNGLK
ncbi:transporter substrate-binding domain-containing protein [Vagococcus elongatus]|uniref:Glutamine ABC transporter substrate-binding protein n=1 Tax=Vagococcus elongatus TaxID=180344 RepID=A0A430AQH8_9ENTE|nr:transporter substrate-binding domain-containing protein [Vagococcus elongatus]RSU10315.1 glutamine ABC transporter substrate-binding protein [Vagococcus elongatus]